MNGSIDLQYQFVLGAVEIDYESINHMLTSELEPKNLAIAEYVPNLFLRLSRPLPESASKCGFLRRQPRWRTHQVQ